MGMVPASQMTLILPPTGETAQRQEQLEAQVTALKDEVAQLQQMVRALLGVVAAQEEQEECDEPVIDYPERLNRQPRLRVGM